MVDQVVKNAPKVSAISSTSGKANNVSTMDVSTMDVSTDVNNNDDKTPLSVASPLEQLVRDLVVCKAVHTMYDSVGALICVLIRKNRSGKFISSYFLVLDHFCFLYKDILILLRMLI